MLLAVAGALILLSPLVLLRQHAISERPIVRAAVSDQRVTPPTGKSGPHVLATVEFDRPSKIGPPVHCKISDQFVGRPSDSSVFDNQIHLAVRTDSCFDAVRVP